MQWWAAFWVSLISWQKTFGCLSAFNNDIHDIANIPKQYKIKQVIALLWPRKSGLFVTNCHKISLLSISYDVLMTMAM